MRLAAGFFLLIKGAEFLVDEVTSVARRFHASDLVIRLTVVAFGTSTPELFVNLMASLKGNADIAIGNVVGSNIFNILFVLGISAIVKPLPFQPRSNVDVGMVILASVLLFFFYVYGKTAVHRQMGRGFVCDTVCGVSGVPGYSGLIALQRDAFPIRGAFDAIHQNNKALYFVK